MKQPDNIQDAMREIDRLLSAASADLERYLLSENPVMEFSPEYFESVKDAVLDARMLVIWAKNSLIK